MGYDTIFSSVQSAKPCFNLAKQYKNNEKQELHNHDTNTTE